MTFSRIAVQIFAENIQEKQSFSDVLADDQTGVLFDCENTNDTPMVALICPSAPLDLKTDLPAVMLGRLRDGVKGTVLETPAKLSEILKNLEGLAGHVMAEPMHYGGWVLDTTKLLLKNPNDVDYTLTDTEARLLACLIQAQGAEISKEVLLQKVWGYRQGLDTHTLETHIYRLRKKIEPDQANPSFLMTSDSGYYLRDVR